MARYHASVSSVLIGLCLLGGSPVLAQTTDRTGPQTQIQPILPPEWKPDLVVTSATATTVCTAQGTVTANIVATIKNHSAKGTADLSKVPWHIIAEARWWSQASSSYLENPSKQTVKPQVGGPTMLKPGQTWLAKFTILGIPKYKSKLGNTVAGNYVFEVKADPLKGVAEGNENNNTVMTTAPDACFKL